MEADEPEAAVVERLWDSRHDLESERLPEGNGSRVRLDDVIELDAAVALLRRPLQRVRTECTANISPPSIRRHHGVRHGDRRTFEIQEIAWGIRRFVLATPHLPRDLLNFDR